MHEDNKKSPVPGLLIGVLTATLAGALGWLMAPHWAFDGDRAFILFLAGFLALAGCPRWLRLPVRRHSLPVLSPRPR